MTAFDVFGSRAEKDLKSITLSPIINPTPLRVVSLFVGGGYGKVWASKGLWSKNNIS